MRTLSWGSNEVPVESLEELERLVDELAETAESEPFMVTVARDDGAMLSIGIGLDESTASYVPGSLDPPYLASRGNGEHAESVFFLVGGEVTEFGPEHVIPADAARQALRLFFASGELTPDVAWEEV
jgi:hypothetical protein